MKKILFTAALLLTQMHAGFDFGECSGSGTFEQQIVHYNGDYENTAYVGEVPAGIKGLEVALTSDKDVDIRLYASSGDRIVHWPYGIFNQAYKATKAYQDVNITYSGYNGFGGLGHEYISVKGATPTTFIMRVFGYQSGYATVNYSWTGKEGCTVKESGSGSFEQPILNRATAMVGTIPPNVSNVDIKLTSTKDIDIQLYGQDGTAIARWSPAGLMAGSTEQNIEYHGMQIIWSGYNGVGGQSGNEFIKIIGKTTETLTMKVYGYQAGTASVNYTWGNQVTQDIKKIPAGFIMRGKTKQSYCDFARGDVDGGYCQIAWADLEPQKGVYDFSLIDEALEKASIYNQAKNLSDENGFKVLIRIRTGVYSPNWVKNEVGSIDWYFKDESKLEQLPIFWETPFQDLYKGMMQSLSDRYDNNDGIGLVAAAMCMTKHTEIMWNRTGRTEVNSIDMAHLRNAHDANGIFVPYTNEKDYKCLEKQVDIHKDVWKRTPSIFGSHIYQIYNYSTGRRTQSYEKTLDIFNYCIDTLGKRCILGNNNLSHTDTNTDNNVNKALQTINQKNYNTYYQTHVFKDGVFDFPNLKTALDIAISWGSPMIELPMGWDCPEGEEASTSDKTQCTNADIKSEILAPYRARLKANYKE